MSKVNGIPTAQGFKKRLGRTGLSSKFKKSDDEIGAILSTLQNAGYWRANSTPAALPPLRMVRKACIAWMNVNLLPGKRAARPKITDLCDAAHLRITTLIEFNFFKSKDEHETKKWKGAMSSVHDEIRLRRGGGVGRSLSEHYGVERHTSSHLPKPSATQAQAKWRQADTKLGLEDWIEQVLLPQMEEDPYRVYFTAGMIPNFHITSLRTQRVKYCTPEERDGYLITVEHGVVKDASGNPYHTGAKETAFSGAGWAIYVMDFDKNFYSESHIINEFHHSSFLAGGPVLGAGELAVDSGRLVALTNKTGHYQAGEKELERTLEVLQSYGVDLASIKVNDPFRAKGKWFTGRAAYSADGKLAGLPDGVTVSAPAKVQN